MASHASAPLFSQSNATAPNAMTQPQQVRPEQSSQDHGGSHGSNNENEKARSTVVAEQKIGGAVLDITWALMCLSLPMVVLTAIFLGLVYGYEVSNSPQASTDLLGRRSSLKDGSAYFVDYSATRLITVSSWTSTVTSLTTTFIMVLVSYPLAKQFYRKSESGLLESLPTTYQLSLLIGLIQGGWGPLWSWLQYCVWKGRNKHTGLLWTALATAMGGTTLR